MNVLKFWFPAGKSVNEATMKLWFAGNPTIDLQIKNQFEASLLAITQITEAMLKDPEIALSTTILLDQFPRSIYRGTARMFGFDKLALTLAKQAVQSGLDLHPILLEKYGPAARTFFYLPFEHSEALEDQVTSVRLFEGLSKDHPSDLTKAFLNYAHEHKGLIERFGRFPHRNALLGRESTPEELAFLAGGGQTFGTTSKEKSDL